MQAVHNQRQMRMRSVVRANAGSRPPHCWLFVFEELDPRPLRCRSLQAGNADNGARNSVQPLLRLSLVCPRKSSVQTKKALVEGKTFFGGRDGNSAVVDAQKQAGPLLPDLPALVRAGTTTTPADGRPDREA